MGFICYPDLKLKEIKKTIAIGKAKEIKTEINFTTGLLNIKSSSNQLSEGIYKYSKDKWKPTITYSESQQFGNLKIFSFVEDANFNYSNSKSFDNADSCMWDISLNNKLKNDIAIKLIAGKGNIDLSNCELKRFDCSMTAGEMNINLRNSSVPNFIFSAFAGKVVIDLSGNWKNDLNANIKGGVGEISLRLPSKKGIKLNVVGILGEVNIPKLNKQGNTYTNSLFGKTKESLYIDITGGIGNVNVQLVD